MISNSFVKFCQHLRIPSKSKGVVRLNLNKPQLYLLSQIEEGLSQGIRSFVVLKARQMGITTFSIAWNLFWAFRNAGINGVIISHQEEQKEYIRYLIDFQYQSLPKQFKLPVKASNPTSIRFANGSILYHLINSTRKRIDRSGNLGRGMGINYIHGTEVSSWSDLEGFQSLLQSKSDDSPVRFYLLESTAKGFNIFYDIYKQAKESLTQKAIFIPWWMNDEYRISRDDPRYRIYARDPDLEERAVLQEIRKLYGCELSDEQLAWWRWKLQEEFYGDLVMAYREYPPTEKLAFAVTRSEFFSSTALTDAWKVAREKKPELYRYIFGSELVHLRLEKAPKQSATLFIYEPPDDGSVYVIGADPAFSDSADSNYNAVEIFKCLPDMMIQVAEFRQRGLNTEQFAWVIAHLAGLYKNSHVILEINGAGQAVFAELKHLESVMSKIFPDEITSVIRTMRHYLYRRIDSPSKSFAYQWKTSHELKEMMMGLFKNLFENKKILIYSQELLEEMERMERSDQGVISSPSDDDLVIAAAMCSIYYKQYIRQGLLQKAKYLHPMDRPLTDFLRLPK